MKIGIWGSYNHGNYGDDVMALMFAKVIKEVGATPFVYRLDSKLAERYSVTTIASVERLLKETDLCIIGGGGMLVATPWVRRNLRKTGRNFEKDFRELYEANLGYRRPIFPISVGGSGGAPRTHLTYWREKVWQDPSCQLSTVRLESDVETLKNLGKSAAYYPDVVLSIPEVWQIKRIKPKTNNTLNIGINVNKKRSRHFISSICALATERPKWNFYFIRSHLPNYPYHYEALPDTSNFNTYHYQYQDPLEILDFISQLDVLVSSKLHLGVTALSLGVPFVSFSGKAKTQAFYRAANSNAKSIWSHSQAQELANFLSSERNIRDLVNKIDFQAIETLRKSSYQHIKHIKELATRGPNAFCSESLLQ